jgi:phosphatidylglycerophosphate synthase
MSPSPSALLNDQPRACFSLRIPLAAVFWLLSDRPSWAFAVLALAALTDVIDGASPAARGGEIVLLPMLLVFRLAPARLRMRYDFRAGRMGKLATVAQFLAVTGLLADWPDGGLVADVAGALGAIAALTYLQRVLQLARSERPRSSVPSTSRMLPTTRWSRPCTWPAPSTHR